MSVKVHGEVDRESTDLIRASGSVDGLGLNVFTSLTTNNRTSLGMMTNAVCFGKTEVEAQLFMDLSFHPYCWFRDRKIGEVFLIYEVIT